MPRLGEVLETLESWFDPSTAEAWDAVGLVCGDPAEPLERILLAIDAAPATVDEAIAIGSQLLITHHPLLLRGVHGVAANDPKGALVHRLIRAGVAYQVIHTNADVASPGVSDALAGVLGLDDVRPLAPTSTAGLDKLVVYIPVAVAGALIDALAAAGAGQLGAYDRCAWSTVGEGTFRPAAAAHPAIGQVGEIAIVEEARVEMVVPVARRASVLQAMRAAHPYEEPAFDLLPMAALPDGRGLGRIGQLRRPMSLRDFTAHVAAVLPATAAGIRAAGPPDQLVTTIAVCGGSGADLVETARAGGADAYLTADLKHHQVLEAVTERGAGMCLVDAGHWATEHPWLDALAARLRDRFGDQVDGGRAGTTVEVAVSVQVTDPWTLHTARPVHPV